MLKFILLSLTGIPLILFMHFVMGVSTEITWPNFFIWFGFWILVSITHALDEAIEDNV